MNKQNLIKKYLQDGRVMQLATSVGDQPWVCTVYYVMDRNFNIYWLSFPSRRHSQEISKNNKVAITVPVKFELPVVGVQAVGIAEEVVDQATVKVVMDLYSSKYDAGHSFYENFKEGTNRHQMYKLIPSNFVLFDELNFPKASRQEWQPDQNTDE